MWKRIVSLESLMVVGALVLITIMVDEAIHDPRKFWSLLVASGFVGIVATSIVIYAYRHESRRHKREMDKVLPFLRPRK